MVMRVLVRSRNGNVVLAAVGALYALAAVGVLVWFVVDVWQAATLTDVMLQVALLASAASGVWFMSNALENLRNDQRSDRSKPASIQR